MDTNVRSCVFAQEERRVLLVDDSALILDLMREALALGGYEVQVASSAGSFLTAMSDMWQPQRRPHVIVLDVNMPGVTGPDMCRWIRMKSGRKRIPVLLFSSLPEGLLAELAKSSGADGFLRKAAHEKLCSAVTALYRTQRVES
jgi:CheY-like chemotaxis protein